MARRPKPWFRKARGAWFVTLDGVQHNLGPEKKAAFDRFYELMRQPQTRTVSSQSLVAVVDAFLDWVQRNRSPDTYEWYRYRLERFCQRYPDLKLDGLKPFHVQQWVDGYPDLSRTSRRNYLRTVKRCCKWAVQQGYLPASPVEHLEMPGGDRRESIVTADEYQRLLSLARDEAFRDLIVVTWETGCRPQELLRVEARHVDLPNQRWVFPKSEAKGRRQPRVVYLPPPAVEITERRLAEFPSGPLFRNSAGKPWTPDAVNCAFDRLRVRILKDLPAGSAENIAREIDKLIPDLDPQRMVDGEAVPKTAKQIREEARRKVLARLANNHIPRYSLYALRHSWATRAL
ncbi:MAG: tyrosine-type recombinase/integrase, partial [Planctomycetaceae bacterium]|nr:tyrosine-type recombinase/integrase [Planctomycetaceae bacterium]